MVLMKMSEMEALLYTQNLVDNDKSIRMRTLSKLKKFLSQKSKNKGEFMFLLLNKYFDAICAFVST